MKLDEDAHGENPASRHEREQRLRQARLPLADKIRWLEEAQQLAVAMGYPLNARYGSIRPDLNPEEST